VTNENLTELNAEMLSALKGLLDNTYEREQDKEFYDKARAVIAKVEGR